MTSPTLTVRDVNYRYRTRSDLALKHCHFEAHAGEIILVAGASGCGKTTLMRCINGLIPRSYKGGDLSGEIRLHGKDPSQLSLADISQLVGTLLQDPEKQVVGSYVLNEVAFGLENLGMPRADMIRRVDETLAYLGISHLRDRETFALSGGEKQKVALAGVLAMQPDIILLDEPLASLDPASSQEALQIFRKLADEGKTILLIEHRVEDVLSIHPDKVLYLEEGEQRYFGPVPEFLQQANPTQVKLPAEISLHSEAIRARSYPPAASLAREDARALVEFKDVDYWYDPERPVLHGVNAVIREGDVIALLGANGAGKSTLVKHAICLLRPRRGQVLVEGNDTHKVTAAQTAHTVGYVFQSPTHMLFAPTVVEELAFGPRNLGFDEPTIAANVAHALEVVRLQGLEDVPPLSLSFGQQRRVGIAAILAMKSKILVMDEPTAGQDYQSYTAFMDAIMAMRSGENGKSPFKAIVFITHDVDMAVTYANRVWLFSDGRLRADGTPEEVLADDALLRECRVVPTSLVYMNRKLLPRTGRFLRIEALATLVASTEIS